MLSVGERCLGYNSYSIWGERCSNQGMHFLLPGLGKATTMQQSQKQARLPTSGGDVADIIATASGANAALIKACISYYPDWEKQRLCSNLRNRRVSQHQGGLIDSTSITQRYVISGFKGVPRLSLHWAGRRQPLGQLM